MSTIYEKLAGDKTVILSPRESGQRAFDYGSTWTEIRMGMFVGNVAAVGDNTAGALESVTINNVYDNIAFGLKNSSDVNPPGVAGTLFVGVGSTVTSSYKNADASGSYNAAGNSGVLDVYGYAGVTLVNGSGDVDNISYPNDPSPATAYCGFYAIKIVIANRGLATQQLSITSAKTSSVAGADYSPAALRTLMGTFANPSTTQTLAWNDGAAARTIPDAVYCRMPFYNNRIRMSGIRISRYA